MITKKMFGRVTRLSPCFYHLPFIALFGSLLAFGSPSALALTDEEADQKLSEMGFNVGDPAFPPDLLNAFRDMVRSMQSGFSSQEFTTDSTETESFTGGSVEVASGSLYGPSSGFFKNPSGEFQVYQMTVNPDRSVTLRWEGPADRVFDIEVSEDLVNWQTVTRDHPSDNGFSIWSDVGDPFAVDAVAHPAFANRGFYRIRATDLIPTDLPTGIVALTSYDNETGIAVFEVTADSGWGPPIAEVTLLVNGRAVGRADASPFIFEVDTTRFWNGEHEVRAVITDSLAVDPPTGDFGLADEQAPGSILTPPINLTTDNFISSFRIRYPAFAPSEEGHIQEFSARFKEAATWTLEVIPFDSQTPVWSTVGESEFLHTIWDGLDANSQPIPGGRYRTRIIAEASGGGLQILSSGSSSAEHEWIRVLDQTFGVMWQGHHPVFSGSYWIPRQLPFSFSPHLEFMTSSGHQGPWGRIRNASRIGSNVPRLLREKGYLTTVQRGDDDVHAHHLRKSSEGGTNLFNTVHLGLFIGHGSSARQAEDSMAPFPQAYIPIHNRSLNNWEWVRTVQMEFGSSTLKWMHLYTCGFLRDSEYRPHGIYDVLKNNFALPMNTDLHILSAYATESIIHPNFSTAWVSALTGDVGPQHASVIRAWAYAGSRTQLNDPTPNVARSVYWPESFNDHIFGYGPQTSPNPTNSQAILEEFDTVYH